MSTKVLSPLALSMQTDHNGTEWLNFSHPSSKWQTLKPLKNICNTPLYSPWSCMGQIQAFTALLSIVLPIGWPVNEAVYRVDGKGAYGTHNALWLMLSYVWQVNRKWVDSVQKAMKLIHPNKVHYVCHLKCLLKEMFNSSVFIVFIFKTGGFLLPTLTIILQYFTASAITVLIHLE